MDIATLAGLASTALFAAANLPMLAKAIRTHDLSSYSPTSLIVSNAANVVHTIYVASLPVGPIWVLHGFYLVVMAIMVVLYVRYARHGRRTAERTGPSADVRRRPASPGASARLASIADAVHPALPCRHA